MEISTNFQHREAAAHWYKHWTDKGYFSSVPDERPPYTIVMPPPNVTGVLHMGHALNNTVQDVLIRRAKMQGFNTCWVPGTDHASIATEAKVVGMLREKGIDKATLSRDEFLAHAWEWKEKYGGIILQQLKQLGCSLDWNRTTFTMDPDYYAAVIRVFVELYEKGLIYRGVKMINWDPKAKTALSDEEVIHRQTNSKLFYVRYKIVGTEDEYITVATVRPETILGDTAVCVHPDDPRYAGLKGKQCIVPLTDRAVPIIFDDYIDPEFGTGALKVTPAHDLNDYNLGLKHRLPVIDTLNDDGTMSEAAGLFVGEDRFVVRKKIVEALRESGNLVKEEAYSNQVGFSERTDAVIEPRLSMQWWCKMEELARPAMDAVNDGSVEFIPPKFRNLYRHWMENIKDWCVSRQLWWGQRIPAWYDASGNLYVAETEAEALAKYRQANPQGQLSDLKQDVDVLDTWFSSWLWPLEVFGWNKDPENAELNYYYPTQTLVTGSDIIFFWVARMIMAGFEFKNGIPFEKVYFTGILRDKQGRKMSKQLGNSPDLLELIEQHGADAVRLSVLISSPAGNDVLFDEAALEQGRNFCNKIWNALKLLKGWESRIDGQANDEAAAFALDWMEHRLASVSAELNTLFADFRLSEALKQIYSLIWDDFCSWFLEWIKPAQEAPIGRNTYERAVSVFESLLQLLHPFMPMITEDIYHRLRDRRDGDDLIVRQLANNSFDSSLLHKGARLQELISLVRDSRNRQQLKWKDAISLHIDTSDRDFYSLAGGLLSKQTNAELLFATQPVAGAVSLVAGTDKIYLVAESGGIDKEQQAESLQKDLEYLRGFLASVEKKLSNERFVSNAKPEVIDAERKKQSDALSKIKTIEESLSLL